MDAMLPNEGPGNAKQPNMIQRRCAEFPRRLAISSRRQRFRPPDWKTRLSGRFSILFVEPVIASSQKIQSPLSMTQAFIACGGEIIDPAKSTS